MAWLKEVKHSEVPSGTRETRTYDNGTSTDITHNTKEGCYVDITDHDHNGKSRSWEVYQPWFGGDPVRRKEK